MNGSGSSQESVRKTTGVKGNTMAIGMIFRISRHDAGTIRSYFEEGMEGTGQQACRLAGGGVAGAHGRTYTEGLVCRRRLGI